MSDRKIETASVSLHRTPRWQPPGERIDVVRPPFPGLKFHLPFEYPRDALVDLSGFSRPRLAEQVARIIWADHFANLRFRSFGSVNFLMETLRRFDDFLACADPGFKIQAINDLKPSDIDAFDVWAHGTWPEGSIVPFSHLSNLVAFLKVATDHRFASPELAPRLDFVSRFNTRIESTPREPYSPFVMQQIREGARAAVEATLARMAPARLLPASTVPLAHFTCENEVLVHLRDVGLVLDHAWLGKRLARLGTGQTSAGILDQIYPGIPDLAPFAILIADDCGLPPECIHELKDDCLEETDEDFGLGFLHYVKRRRRGSEENVPEPVKTKEPWSAGHLVKQLLDVTEVTRRQMRRGGSEGADALFIGRAGTKLKPLRVNQHAFEAHLRRHPVQDENGDAVTGIELSRIRKTVKAARYESVGGDLHRIGKDHTRLVFGKNYGIVRALDGTHEATIAAALTSGLGDALRTTVLSAADERQTIAAPTALAAKLGVDDARLLRVVEGSSDVVLAGCLDFANSPYRGDKACGAPFWGCVDCRNAIITRDKLPALLRLLEHLRNKRQQMDLLAFFSTFGFVFARIQQIIARFDAAEIEAALEEVRDDIGQDWMLAELTYTL